MDTLLSAVSVSERLRCQCGVSAVSVSERLTYGNIWTYRLASSFWT